MLPGGVEVWTWGVALAALGVGPMAEIVTRRLPAAVGLYDPEHGGWEAPGPAACRRVAAIRGASASVAALAAAGSGVWAFGPGTIQAIALAAFAWAAIVLAVVDLDHRWVPDRICVPLLLVGLAASPLATGPEDRIAGLIAFAVPVWAIMAGLSRVHGPDAMSGGDILFAAAAGAWLGAAPAVAFLALGGAFFFLQGVVLARLRGSAEEAGPMVPALAAGAVAAALLAAQGWSWPIFPG